MMYLLVRMKLPVRFPLRYPSQCGVTITFRTKKTALPVHGSVTRWPLAVADHPRTTTWSRTGRPLSIAWHQIRCQDRAQLTWNKLTGPTACILLRKRYSHDRGAMTVSQLYNKMNCTCRGLSPRTILADKRSCASRNHHSHWHSAERLASELQPRYLITSCV